MCWMNRSFILVPVFFRVLVVYCQEGFKTSKFTNMWQILLCLNTVFSLLLSWRAWFFGEKTLESFLTVFPSSRLQQDTIHGKPNSSGRVGRSGMLGGWHFL